LKKTAAIILSLILLFNIAGYQLFFNLLEKKASAKLEIKIDEGSYSNDQLVEIKIPLSMPYFSDKDYEAVFGETEWNGQHYSYVKRKVSNNTLYLLCLPNNEKNSIAKVKNDFTIAINDFQGNKKGNEQKDGFLKIITGKYRSNESAEVNFNLIFSKLNFYNRNIAAKDLFSPNTEIQPPKSV